MTQQSTAFGLRITKFINEIKKSFGDVDLCHFSHDMTFGSNKITFFTDDPTHYEFYARKSLPLVCTDQSGRILKDGIYLAEVLQAQQRDCAVIFPKIQKIFSFKNAFYVVKRHEHFQDMFSFHFNSCNEDFLHFVVNNGQLVNDFIENYRIKAKDYILEGQEQCNQLLIPTYEEFDPKGFKQLSSNIDQLTLRHHKTNHQMHFSKQQTQCLLLLIEGKTAKQMAEVMHLSVRTIEHYLARIKLLLNCVSVKELLIKYMDQIAKYKNSK